VCLVALAWVAVLFAAPVDRAASTAVNDLATPSQRFGDLTKAQDPSYRRHVVPLLARTGCSARECHGSFQGRGGFQLSLFGSEWEQDYVQLTQKKGGEDEIRVNANEPEKSLILMKPTLQMKHKGKERFKKDSWQYNMLLKWIQGGTKNDSAATGELQRLEVTPSELVFSRPGESIQLRVLAHWNDGVVEDVTEITRFKTSDETVANVADTGLVSCTGKGDTHVVASYDNGVVPIPVMLPVSQFAGSRFPATTASTKIDELVLAKLRKVGIVPSDVCTDAEFLRRASLDLTGTLPAPDEVKVFLADSSAGKRSAKIDELLKTPAYAAWWTTKFCDYTGNSPRAVNIGGNINRNNGEVSRQWYDWLYKRVTDNTPYDKMVQDIVLSTSRSSPDQTYKDYSLESDSYFRSENPVNYATHPTLAYFWQRRTAQSAEEKALSFSHTFLGVRLECAQCHKHPFDRWTKTDFKQFTAFFGPIANGQRPADKTQLVSYQTINEEIKAKVTAAFKTQYPDEADDAMMMDARPEKKKAKAEAVKGEVAKAANDSKEQAGTDAKISKESADAKAPKDSKEAVAATAKNAKDAKETTVTPVKKKKELTADQKKRQFIQRETQAEIKRRIDANELVPWPEVFANSKGLPMGGKNKGGRFDPSITPKILGGEQQTFKSDSDPRSPLMDWLRSKSNPYFAKAIVNRVWATYFNRGIVDPPDDMNIANAPCNGELLNYLATGFIEHGYDMKWLHREILNSDTYQRSWRTNPTNALDSRNFSHAVVRQMPAEVILDALNMAVGPTAKLDTYKTEIDTRAIGPGGTSNYTKRGGGGGPDGYFLTLFGKPTRETNCDCERSTDPTLLQTLFTRNDPTLLAKIEGYGGKSSSFIAELRRDKNQSMDTDSVISDVFLRTVSRPPTSEEITEAKADIAAAKTPVDGVRDLLWVMVNTREFKVNH
jgi:hypothetical protein